MIKQIITTTTLIAASVAMANAETVIIDFGKATGMPAGTYVNKGDTSTTTTGGKTVNRVDGGSDGGTLSALNDLKDTTGVATTWDLSASTGAGGFASGAAGALGMYTAKPALPTGVEEIFGGVDVWGDCLNKNLSFTLTLEANSTYKLQLFAGRKNDYGMVNDSTYTFSGASSITSANYTIGSAKTDLTLAANAESVEFNGTSIVSAVKAANGGALMEVILTTGDAGTVTFATSGTGTNANASFNALAITAIPEPSMFGLLAGLGALALVGARRRRK